MITICDKYIVNAVLVVESTRAAAKAKFPEGFVGSRVACAQINITDNRLIVNEHRQPVASVYGNRKGAIIRSFQDGIRGLDCGAVEPDLDSVCTELQKGN